MLLGVNGLAILWVSRGWAHVGLAPLLLAAIALSFIAERCIPYQPVWNEDHGDHGRDLAHALVNEALSAGSLLLLPFLSGTLARGDLWPHEWPFPLQVIAAVLLMDAGVTLAHLASHKLSWLWRFHAVHHSVERLYGFNGLMKHPLHQLIEMTAGVAPLLALGLPLEVAVILAFATAIQLLLQHSNADYRVGALRYLFALNEGHRFHHRRGAALGDVNFGLFTLIWDHLLGTFRMDSPGRFREDEIGLDGPADYPLGYLDQLRKPFRRGPTPRSASPLRHRIHEDWAAARACGQVGDWDRAWKLLETAHVLSQAFPWLHVRAHWEMLLLGARLRDRREVLGQVARLVVAGPSSLGGWAPPGNTGRARTPMWLPMPVPKELRAVLAGATARAPPNPAAAPSSARPHPPPRMRRGSRESRAETPRTRSGRGA